ncbi:MAG: dicarboxylate/amino acid:cation symporter [Myxococcota bacterium]
MDPIEQLHLAPLRRLASGLDDLVRSHLWAQVLVGLVLGVGVGVLLGPDVGLVSPAIAGAIVPWLALPGTLFLVLVQMIVIPLVFASIVRGLAAGETMAQLRRLGLRATGYFLVTSTVAISIGVGLAQLLKPGRFVQVDSLTLAVEPLPEDRPDAELPSLDSVPDALVGLFPTNPLASAVSGEMLELILFAIIFGLALVALPKEKSAPIFEILGSLQDVCMTVVGWAMRLAPVAVFGLIAKLTANTGADVLVGLAGYMGTVVLGLLVLVLFYLLLLGIFGRVAPGRFLKEMRALQLLAFSTSSSAAVMPLSLETAEKQLGVRQSVAGFLIPLGATVNMDGTALYQGVATVFLAQVFQVPLDGTALVLVVVTAVAASIGSPATPGVGVVILASVLETVGVPATGIALLIGVDRILDMCRTAVNVTGDVTAAVILDRWTGADAQTQRSAHPSGATDAPEPPQSADVLPE